ncbi:MAG: sensor histidine kinase, partial [Saccharothrix sp.]|nr:sensor histidine kinase [Saccharothrix sp.]
MRSRILRAILLAVAVTGFALGIPLGYTALRLVEDGARTDLAARAQRIAASIDDQIADGRSIDLGPVEVGVPDGGHLVVTSTDQVLEFGTTPGSDALSVEVPIAQQGTVRLEVSSAPMHTAQYQVAALVVLLVALSVGTGTVVATVTARRLA